MGIKVSPATVRQWEQSGLIPPAAPPKRRKPGAHQHRDDGDLPPRWRVAIEIPGLALTSRSNERSHWSTRHRRDKREAQAVRSAWRAAGLSGWTVPLPVKVTLTRIGGKRMDGDNLQSALKAVRDQLAKLIGIDDGDARVRWRYRQKPGPTPAVTLTLRRG